MKRMHIVLALAVLATGCASLPPTDVNPNAIGLNEDQMLLLKSSDGAALVDFLNFAADGKRSPYRWRYIPANGGAEQNGEGVVFEKYKSTKTGPGKYDVEDIGSELMVKAGSFEVEWSYSSSSSGWLYVDKEKIRAEALPDTDFETYKLK